MLNPKTFRRFFPYVLTILCCGLVARYFTLHTDEFASIFLMDLPSVLTVGVLIVAVNFLNGARMFLLVHESSSNKIPFLSWLKIFIVSRFLNFHLTQAANIYRSITLKRKYNFSYTDSVSLILTFAWLDIIWTLLMSLLCLGAGSSYFDGRTLIFTKILSLFLLGMVMLPFSAELLLDRKSTRLNSSH